MNTLTLHSKEYDDDQHAPRRTCVCGDDIQHGRWSLGYRLCMNCGNQAAISARRSWCVVQSYGKGPYQFVTNDAAPMVLLDTNQKAPRS